MNEIDIGSKIKKARLDAKLTQEDAAESLHVSRQTISNWENGKTYPDIISVIRMSDLYSVSLDLLLKEEKAMAKNYIEYLEESTNVVKSKRNLGQIIVCATSLLIWVLALVVFWFFTDGVGAFGYSLMFLYFILPINILVTSLVFGLKNYWGKGKFVLPFINGILYMFSEMFTFGMANFLMNKIVSFNPDEGIILERGLIYQVSTSNNGELLTAAVRTIIPEWGLLIAGIVISFVGIGIGIGIRAIMAKKR